MSNAKELGAPRIPYGPHAVEETFGASRRLAGSLARCARRLAGAMAAASTDKELEMTIDYRKPPLDPETRTVRTPPAWPFTFTARALFGTARPGPAWLER